MPREIKTTCSRKANPNTAAATAKPLSNPLTEEPEDIGATAGRFIGAGAAAAGAAPGVRAPAAADDAADAGAAEAPAGAGGAGGAGRAAPGAGAGPPGGGEGNRTVGAAVGLGGSAMRTVSFLG